MGIKVTISHRKDTRTEDYKPFNPYRTDLLILITKFINNGVPPIKDDHVYIDHDGMIIPFIVYDRMFISNEVMYIIDDIQKEEVQPKQYLN